jgi:hypothetical protein
MILFLFSTLLVSISAIISQNKHPDIIFDISIYLHDVSLPDAQAHEYFKISI